MPRVLVDEDLPRSLAGTLRAHGVDAIDVRDIGLRSAPDDDVFSHAVNERLTVISGDLGCGNVLRFPLDSHLGIVVVRYPNEVSSQVVNEAVAQALREVSEADIIGAVVIVSPGGIRIRRHRR